MSTMRWWVAGLVDIANEAANETDSFYDGLALALESMLISPEVLFIAVGA